MKFSVGVVLTAVLLLVAACASNLRQQQAQLRTAYTAAAGPNVPQFRYTRPLYSWQPLGDQELVVYTQPRKAYLLSLGFCPDLGMASAIALGSHLGWVTSGLDNVRVGGSRTVCRIQQIRAVDLAKFATLRTTERHKR